MSQKLIFKKGDGVRRWSQEGKKKRISQGEVTGRGGEKENGEGGRRQWKSFLNHVIKYGNHNPLASKAEQL